VNDDAMYQAILIPTFDQIIKFIALDAV